MILLAIIVIVSFVLAAFLGVCAEVFFESKSNFKKTKSVKTVVSKSKCVVSPLFNNEHKHKQAV